VNLPIRLDAIFTLTKLKQQHISSDIQIRVITNGILNLLSMPLLHGSATLLTIAQQIKDTGVNAVSIALMTSCPEQYNQLISPKH
jgi:hypothetical protein